MCQADRPCIAVWLMLHTWPERQSGLQLPCSGVDVSIDKQMPLYPPECPVGLSSSQRLTSPTSRSPLQVTAFKYVLLFNKTLLCVKKQAGEKTNLYFKQTFKSKSHLTKSNRRKARSQEFEVELNLIWLTMRRSPSRLEWIVLLLFYFSWTCCFAVTLSHLRTFATFQVASRRRWVEMYVSMEP